MGPWTARLQRRLYWGDPDDALRLKESDEAARESKCPVCDWCYEPITDETFRQRTDHNGRVHHYHEDCATEWFEDNFSTVFTDDYIGESE